MWLIYPLHFDLIIIESFQGINQGEDKMALEHLNDDNFEATVAGGIVIVDFWASWCGPCQMFSPIFEKVSEKHTNIKFAKFEIDESNRRTPAKYGIRSIPSILAFKDGKVVEAKTGLMDKDDFDDWVGSIK